MKTIFSSYFLVRKGLSNAGVRVTRGTLFEDIRSGSDFKTGDSVRKVGGATVVRPISNPRNMRARSCRSYLSHPVT